MPRPTCLFDDHYCSRPQSLTVCGKELGGVALSLRQTHPQKSKSLMSIVLFSGGAYCRRVQVDNWGGCGGVLMVSQVNGHNG